MALDGTIDWLCLPDLDSPSVFGALLDADRGGSFELAPELPFQARRRYLPETNVLETTFETETGAARVTDAMLLPGDGFSPERELVRRVEGLAGEVAMRWRVDPRFGYGAWRTRLGRRQGVPVATSGADAIAIGAWGAGEPEVGPESVSAGFSVAAGAEALLALSASHGTPLVLPARKEAGRRLAATIDFWRGWSAGRRYQGPWREAVLRSALALKLLLYSPSGAIAAAATTSLPEELGGVRNWDYRYSWIRDSAFTVDALLRLGCPYETSSFFWWLLHASQLTHPRLRVLYRLNGRVTKDEHDLPWDGYRRSRPVRVGNGAAGQRQLDLYGHLLATAFLYAEAGGEIDHDTGKRLAATADFVADCWQLPDAGIWEVRDDPRHFTESKMMCKVALDRAATLAEQERIPAGNAGRWRREAAAIREFVEQQCWSEGLGSYVRFAGADELDASLLLGVLMGFAPGDDERLRATTERVAEQLGEGPLVWRYRGEDGLPGTEGAFLACSFWLADALARHGELERAERLMEELLALANDVGIYAEELEPSGEFLGNVPQGLVHLGLINAAASIEEASR